MKLSIIIVAYKNKQILDRCLASIPKRDDWEVIVVDNSEDNRGFGKACNLGAKQAKGEYLLLLNPDTVFEERVAELLIGKLANDSSLGIVAPLLSDEQGEAYSTYSRQPGLIDAFVVFSFLNRVFSRSSLVRRFWYLSVTKKGIFFVDPLSTWSAPNEEMMVENLRGAFFLMRLDDFVALGGFDERFFLYWEDMDLCRRLIGLDKKLLYCPEFCVVHVGAALTPSNSGQVISWFRASRTWFFRKYFGNFLGFSLQLFYFFAERWKSLLLLVFAVLLIEFFF